MPSFEIAGRAVGDGLEPLVVAEIGINHEGSLSVAIEMADAAINSGAEVVKHQTHIPEEEMSREARNSIPGNADVSIYEIVERCALSENDEMALCEHVRSRGAIFFSTPFSVAAVDRLERMNVPAIKIGSGECTNTPIIRRALETGLPLIISTGMHDIQSLIPTVEMVREAKVPYALLHCTNLYPTPAELVRLGGLTELRNAFPDAVIGLSDHSESIYPALASVALGAAILERHFTDRMDRPGPDINSSMTPREFVELRYAASIVWRASGGSKSRIDEERVTADFAFGSVVTRIGLKPGDIIGPEHLVVKRPAGGDFGPNDIDRLLGREVLVDVEDNTQLPAFAVDMNGTVNADKA